MPASLQFVWLDLQNDKTCPYKACLNCPTQTITSYQLINRASCIFSPIIHLCIYWLLPTVIICWTRDPNARLLPVCECARCHSTLATCPKQDLPELPISSNQDACFSTLSTLMLRTSKQNQPSMNWVVLTDGGRPGQDGDQGLRGVQMVWPLGSLGQSVAGSGCLTDSRAQLSPR